MALGVVNVVGRTIARETDAGIYLHAGPEIGVAAPRRSPASASCSTMLALYSAGAQAWAERRARR